MNRYYVDSIVTFAAAIIQLLSGTVTGFRNKFYAKVADSDQRYESGLTASFYVIGLFAIIFTFTTGLLLFLMGRETLSIKATQVRELLFFTC